MCFRRSCRVPFRFVRGLCYVASSCRGLAFAFGEGNAKLIDAVFKCAFDGVSATMKDAEHGVIHAQHVGGETGHSTGDGGGHQIVQQESSNSSCLPIVTNQEGGIGEVGAAVIDVASDRYQLGVFAGVGQDHQGHIGVVINAQEFLKLFMGHGFYHAEEAGVDRFGREFVKEIAEQRFVGQFEGSHEHAGGGVKGRRVLQFIGIARGLDVRLNLIRVDEVAGFRLRQQPGSKFGMGDLNEGHRTLANGFSVQESGAILCHYVVHVAAAGDDAGALFEVGDNARERLVVGGGRESDDRFAALGARRAAGEIHLSADAAVKHRAQGVGADLTGEVDFNGGVDGNHLVVFGDDEGIIDVIRGVTFNQRVVVHEIVELSRTHDETHHDLAGVQGLLGVGNHAFLDQGNQTVAEHFRVDAEVLKVGEIVKNCVGDRADAELQSCAVLNEKGDVVGDLAGEIVGLALFCFKNRAIARYEHVDVPDVNEAIAEYAGHLCVDFGDDDFRGFSGGFNDVGGYAVTAIPVAIRRADGNEGDVKDDAAGSKKGGDFG